MQELTPITRYNLTEHARYEIVSRQISESDIEKVLSAPEQIEVVREGRMIYQSRLEMGIPSRNYLLRIFVDVDRDPPDVVTVYRTSKIEKYWRSKHESGL
jgi:hypothetical protein